ncbi:deoxyguanosinetriphosphate triphosphohydrolase [Caulobacter vibrioides]|uniref:deoxyguanosinetriphosphate triphosphohydrolase n=1 Tax=Caulobacter vibrioides TaxID=155892 RepID=UPI000BB50DA4|nr:deoxyguanosinetriphosphate triphosphohydrolase [Caulobacter vibrioides]ATC24969.1 deoxyguanosinetriphosphate triphosphohydrolase [Caulobacter vibrioides]AZH13122.1 deoxyguanosinetriphosphate triphosphohydrolase [Caulobacter vibrioides]PLR09748.1 deoxyguanosinetriphosphate triphosphohydrolase [Caulobacter vibrioides]
MSQAPYFVPRAPYAEDPSKSKGRRFKEDESRTRTPFARDRDRIIHTSAFRRLKEKTQVFVAHEGDNFRTRLTHTLEVAQVARSLATALGLDADLAETIALAHDLGHPPFGHAGEDELEIQMREYGGFDHNVQTFRVVTELEHRYPDFVGLNLTWETLEGVIKHNGPVTNKLGKPSWKAISKYDNEYELGLGTWASAEAQVAALADDIAYNNHDVDDGVTAGLFTLDDLMDVPLIGPILAAVKSERPDLDARLTHLEAVRRMIGAMVDDVMGETLHRAAASGVQSADDVRALDHALVAFSSDMAEDLARLRGFLYERMYRHWRVNRTRSQARRILGEMFSLFLREPEVLPTVWFAKSQNRDEAGRARVVCDYIAGMTDRFAIEEHRKLFHLDVWN